MSAGLLLHPLNNQISIYCGNALLADGDRDGLSGIVESLSFDGQELVQDAPYIDAQFMEFIDRGIQSSAIQFQIMTEFDDMVDALGYAAALRAAVAGVIDLTISLALGGGKSVTIYCPNAKWDKTKALPMAASVRANFPVTAGLVDVSYSGGPGPTPFVIPFEPANQVDPLTIPAGMAASLGSGEDGFYFGIDCEGSLTVNSGARCEILAA